MLYDCMKVFDHVLSEKGERWLLDSYIPKDGTYILINMDRDFQPEEYVDIIRDKKTEEISGRTHRDFRFFQFLDYNSKLVEMNKPVDPKKTIHSNNMFSFFLKKESLLQKKLTNEIVDKYYELISNPEIKYSKPKDKSLYRKVEEETGPVDTETVNKIKDWIKRWMLEPKMLPDIDLTQKNYLKLFFVYEDRVRTQELYQRENKRYLIPNVYNNNDFNEEQNGIITGLPGNNMGMNSKKPYLANKSRKMEAPCLKALHEVLQQSKFFDFLWGQASAGRVNVYVDFENNKISTYDNRQQIEAVDSGAYLRIRKDKNEAQIQCMDVIAGYRPDLKESFNYKNILDLRPEIIVEIESGYGNKTALSKMNLLFDEVFFGKKLIYNYFTEPSDITFKDRTLENILLTYRERLFGWFYKGIDADMQKVVDEMAGKLICHSIQNGYWTKVKHQINLKWSLTDYFEQNNKMEETEKMVKENLKKHMDMYEEEWNFENDEEYYYAVGQMVSYFLSLSKAAKTPLSMINSFLNAADDKVIKEKIVQLFQKYNYNIDSRKDVRFKNLFNHILLYEAKGKVHKDMVAAGLLDNKIVYEKAEKKDGEKK